MSKQSDYSAEEWLTVSSAPVMAGLLVSLSDVSGPIGMAKEALAVVRAVTESASGGAGELLTSIAASWKAQVTKPQLPELPRDSPDAARNAALEHCKEAAAIVSQKSPSEADEYRKWLVSLARKTAEASKEGGFLGIGGTLVSDAEANAVTTLAKALGASA
jgi:hypothetical protein